MGHITRRRRIGSAALEGRPSALKLLFAMPAAPSRVRLCRSLPLATKPRPCQNHVRNLNEVPVMKRLILFVFLLTVSAAALAQQGTRLPDNRELVTKARSFCVQSDTFYMKREALESSLLGQAEFKAWNLQVTGREELADMLVRVKRVPFSNHFSYTVTDRETDTIVMAGKVDSLRGTVYGRVAREIVEKMVALRGNPLAKPEAATKP